MYILAKLVLQLFQWNKSESQNLNRLGKVKFLACRQICIRWTSYREELVCTAVSVSSGFRTVEDMPYMALVEMISCKYPDFVLYCLEC